MYYDAWYWHVYIDVSQIERYDMFKPRDSYVHGEKVCVSFGNDTYVWF